MMYSDTIFSLRVPQPGQTVTGWSRKRNRNVLTCPLKSVRRLRRLRDRDPDVYQVRTRHEAVYMVVVISGDPGEAARFGIPPLTRTNPSPTPVCPRMNCTGERVTMRNRRSLKLITEFRTLLVWLTILSLLWGSLELVIPKLWELFIAIAPSL